MQWEDVRYFLALAAEGSLSGAARALKVEHSTVGRRVETLETALELRLFDRLARGWQLTADGETMLRLAERMQEEAFAFERAALGAASLRGTVRLSAPPSVASLFLVPRIAARRERWSGIELEIVGEMRDANLSQREADLALRLGRPQQSGLVVRALGKIGFGLYATAGYAKRPEEEWDFLGFDESLRQVPHQQWLENYAGRRRFALRSNDLIALHGAARTGLGIACLPHYHARGDAELVPIPAQPGPPPREAWLVLHADVRRSPRVRAIADLVGEIFNEAEEFLAG